MENALTLASIMAPVYLVIGLSVLLYGKAWQKIVEDWGKNHYSLFPLMLVMVILGLIVVGMHNVWEWSVWLLVTLTGWGMLVKGVLYFLLPGNVIKGLMGMAKNTGMIYLGGIVALIVGAVLGYYSYMV